MKKLFKNRYFCFLMIYFCILSMFGIGLSFSRYKSQDINSDNADTAVYDVVIYSGEDINIQQPVDLHIYATSKISEPESMIEGTYDMKQVNIINLSECTVKLTDFKIYDIKDEEQQSVYTKLVIDKDKIQMNNYISDHENNIAESVLAFLNKKSDEMSDTEELHDIINNKNTEEFEDMDGIILERGEEKTFFIISWVEHDDIYKADADSPENADDRISHKTPTQLGIDTEQFVFSIYSEQVD